MDADQIASSLRQLWENKPGTVVLLAVGFFVFVFLVVDAWRHKRKRRRRPPADRQNAEGRSHK